MLHSFNGNDGANPAAGLVLSGNSLYGTTEYGSNNACGSGTIFRIFTDGSGFTNLFGFAGYAGLKAGPTCALFLSGNTLYGTTSAWGHYGYGAVFSIHTDGSAYSTIYDNFNYSATGGQLYGGVVQYGGYLFGTAYGGGIYGGGTLFRLTTTYPSTFTINYNCVDIGGPNSNLTMSGGTLYGTTGQGAIFAISVNANTKPSWITNSSGDGQAPSGGLLLFNNALYGTAASGGSGGQGVVFKVNADGTGLTNLYSFSALVANTNKDGAKPYGGLVLSGNVLYGTTSSGGRGGQGTVFGLNTDGTGFTNLYNFSALASKTNQDGASPRSTLVLSGNILYGTTYSGGVYGNGTVFALNVSPAPIPLQVTKTGSRVILSWSDPTFSLQASPTVAGNYTNIAGAGMPYTNLIPGQQMFYRLRSN